MNDLIRKFGTATLDVREISCISEQRPSSGPAVYIDIFFKGGGMIAVMFESEEKANKETNWLLLIWKQSVK